MSKSLTTAAVLLAATGLLTLAHAPSSAASVHGAPTVTVAATWGPDGGKENNNPGCLNCWTD
jgi:hypothetical protein